MKTNKHKRGSKENWGKDISHLIPFPTLPFQANLPHLSKIASLHTAVYNRLLAINSEDPLTAQT